MRISLPRRQPIAAPSPYARFAAHLDAALDALVSRRAT
jgi:hypothetical protein